MPITLTLTEGVLTNEKIGTAIEKITSSLLAHHDLSGNKVMTRNVTAHVNIIPKGLSFAAGKPVEGAWIETKTPSFALADNKIQERFFSEATQIIHNLSDGKLSKEKIWANGVHTVDGTWNIDGIPLTNAGIVEAVSKG
ncbi:MAG: hypothetical protein K2Q21_13250 [Chitinophagaceae bacterium]|nr:hypothetical protein [Chitinophagaceae bacterium]